MSKSSIATESFPIVLSDVPTAPAAVAPSSANLAMLDQLAKDANGAHQSIVESEALTLMAAFAVGRHLTEAKRLVPYGEWQQWMQANLRFKAVQARRYMAVHENRDLVEARMKADPDEITCFSDAVRFLREHLHGQKAAASPVSPEPSGPSGCSVRTIPSTVLPDDQNAKITPDAATEVNAEAPTPLYPPPAPADGILSEDQARALAEVDAAMEAADRKWAAAIVRVRDERLWRDDYDSFDEWCVEVVGQSEAKVNRRLGRLGVE